MPRAFKGSERQMEKPEQTNSPERDVETPAERDPEAEVMPPAAGMGESVSILDQLAEPPWVLMDIVKFLLYGLGGLFLIALALAVSDIALGYDGALLKPNQHPLLTLALFVLFAIPFLLYIYRSSTKRYRQSFWISIRWIWPAERGWKYFLAGLVLAMVAIAFEIVVSRYFGPMEPTALWELMTTAQAAYAITFYAVFFAPIAEEVVFRGFFSPSSKSAGALWSQFCSARLRLLPHMYRAALANCWYY
jgi:membrane protease YdiL (CAAX protease family)